MSLFRRFFADRDPLASARRALEHKRWADALGEADRIDRSRLESDALAELEALLVAAGNGLAELNLREGEACRRAGDVARAIEHFQLASAQARTADLAGRIAAALGEVDSHATAIAPSPPAASASACGQGCGSSATSCAGEDATSSGLDSQTRMELILASYPSSLVQRYARHHPAFQEAFLLAHEGEEQAALECFETVPDGCRDDLFYFERGSLLGRIDEAERGCADLEKALSLNPEHQLALETLVQIELVLKQEVSAEKRLRQRLAQGGAPAFTNGWLAVILARRGDLEGALDHAQQAIQGGGANEEILLLAATLLERTGRTDEAEKVLLRLPAGGCGGGPSLPLAEFWLRHDGNLDKALQSFKSALRQEPDNPRWLMRVGQVYLAKGWRREGVEFLQHALADPRLEPELQAEGRILLGVSPSE